MAQHGLAKIVIKSQVYAFEILLNIVVNLNSNVKETQLSTSTETLMLQTIGQN